MISIVHFVYNSTVFVWNVAENIKHRKLGSTDLC